MLLHVCRVYSTPGSKVQCLFVFFGRTGCAENSRWMTIIRGKRMMEGLGARGPSPKQAWCWQGYCAESSVLFKAYRSPMISTLFVSLFLFCLRWVGLFVGFVLCCVFNVCFFCFAGVFAFLRLFVCLFVCLFACLLACLVCLALLCFVCLFSFALLCFCFILFCFVCMYLLNSYCCFLCLGIYHLRPRTSLLQLNMIHSFPPFLVGPR